MTRTPTIIACALAGLIWAGQAAANPAALTIPAGEAATPLPHPGQVFGTPERLSPLARALKQHLEGLQSPHGATKSDVVDVRAFYEARTYEPVWLGKHGFTSPARAVARRLSEAGDDGLDSAAFDIRPPLASDPRFVQVEREIQLTLKALRFAREARHGRMSPSELGKDVSAHPDPFDGTAFLNELSAAPDVVALLDGQNPQTPEFQALRRKLVELRREAGSEAHVPVIPEGPLLLIGRRSPAVPIVRERLGVPAGEGADETVFGPELAAAVRRFQTEHGLWVDGVIGPRTRKMLNASVSITGADIIVNMERWRWLPRDLGDHHVFVNIPEFKARVNDGGETTFETRVIVGKTTNRTPVFSDEIEYVDVNPYWNVPYSIATKEMLPQIRRDPSYIYRRGLQVIYTGGGQQRLVDPMSINWSRVSASNMPFRFRQPPGDANALGRVKFMFPNKHAVYLHDTPTRNLFERAERALSHGCVRVDDPVRFADALLSREANLDGEKIQRLIRQGSNGAHPLKAHVPVHLAYFTLRVDENGELMRWADIYGYDRKMMEMLGLSS